MIAKSRYFFTKQRDGTFVIGGQFYGEGKHYLHIELSRLDVRRMKRELNKKFGRKK